VAQWPSNVDGQRVGSAPPHISASASLGRYRGRSHSGGSRRWLLPIVPMESYPNRNEDVETVLIFS